MNKSLSREPAYKTLETPTKDDSEYSGALSVYFVELNHLPMISDFPKVSADDRKELVTKFNKERKRNAENIEKYRMERYKILSENQIFYNLLASFLDNLIKGKILLRKNAQRYYALRYYEGIKEDSKEAKIEKIKVYKKQLDTLFEKIKSAKICSDTVGLNLLCEDMAGILNDSIGIVPLDKIVNTVMEKYNELSNLAHSDDLESRLEECRIGIDPTKSVQKLLEERKELVDYKNSIIEERNKILNSTLMWLIKEVNSFYERNRWVEEITLSKGDIIQEANTGLIKAAERWDPRREEFTTYAKWWIKQAIYSSIQQKSRVVNIPQEIVKKIISYRKGKINKYGAPFSLNVILGLIEDPLSLETVINNDRCTLNNILSDLNEINPLLDCINSEEYELIEKALSSLTNRESKIINLHYGFDGERMTLEEIGAIFNLGKERIRQIEKKALEKLKKRLIGYDLST